MLLKITFILFLVRLFAEVENRQMHKRDVNSSVTTVEKTKLINNIIIENTSLLPYLEYHYGKNQIQRLTNAQMLFVENQLIAAFYEKPEETTNQQLRNNTQSAPYLIYHDGKGGKHRMSADMERLAEKIFNTTFDVKISESSYDFIKTKHLNYAIFNDGKGNIVKLSKLKLFALEYLLEAAIMIDIETTNFNSKTENLNKLPDSSYLVYYEPIIGRARRFTKTNMVEIANSLVLPTSEKSDDEFSCHFNLINGECTRHNPYIKLFDAEYKERILSDEEIVAIRHKLISSVNIHPIDKIMTIDAPIGSRTPYYEFCDGNENMRKLSFLNMLVMSYYRTYVTFA